MINAICGDCKTEFVAAVILGPTQCPKCGSSNTYCAVAKEEKEKHRDE